MSKFIRKQNPTSQNRDVHLCTSGTRQPLYEWLKEGRTCRVCGFVSPNLVAFEECVYAEGAYTEVVTKLSLSRVPETQNAQNKNHVPKRSDKVYQFYKFCFDTNKGWGGAG